MATAKSKTTSKVTPPKLFSRNEHGLLEDPSIPYEFNEDGSVNWRKMIKPEYLVSNKQNTDETDISKLDDRDLLILLGGIKELAQVRGYHSVEHKVITANPDYVCVVCSIKWIGNYETGGEPVLFEAIADTHPDNTTSFTRSYLSAIAENRAFVRCVRNFLKINIVGKDEIGAKNVYAEQLVADNPLSPVATLINLMNKKNIVFKDVKKRLLKGEYPDAETIENLEQISKPKIFELIERIKKAAGR